MLRLRSAVLTIAVLSLLTVPTVQSAAAGAAPVIYRTPKEAVTAFFVGYTVGDTDRAALPGSDPAAELEQLTGCKPGSGAVRWKCDSIQSVTTTCSRASCSDTLGGGVVVDVVKGSAVSLAGAAGESWYVDRVSATGGAAVVNGVPVNRRIDQATARVELDPAHGQVRGQETLNVTMLAPGSAVVINCASSLNVSEVACDGVPTSSVQIDASSVAVQMPDSAAGQTHVISYSFAGTYREANPSTKRVMWGIGADGVHIPDVFGSRDAVAVDVTFVAPSGWTVVTGGQMTESDLPDGRAEFTYHRTAADSGNIGAGVYEKATSIVDGLPVRVYLLPEDHGQSSASLATAVQALSFLITHCGPCPYDSLTVAEIPREQEGGVTDRNQVFVVPHVISGPPAGSHWANWDYLASHEISHLWWATGSASWLYEGFASYMGDCCVGNSQGETAFQKLLDSQRVGYLEVPVSRDLPILSPAGKPAQVVYDKGAYVLNMLRYQIGDDAFWRTMQTFAAESDRTPEGFEALAKATSGQDLAWFFDQWLRTTDRLDLSVDKLSRRRTDTGYSTSFMVTNLGRAVTPRVDIAITTRAGVERRTVSLASAATPVVITTASPVWRIDLDPGHWLLDVNTSNNSVGFGLLDRGSPIRPFALGAIWLLAIGLLSVATVFVVRQLRRVLISLRAGVLYRIPRVMLAGLALAGLTVAALFWTPARGVLIVVVVLIAASFAVHAIGRRDSRRANEDLETLGAQLGLTCILARSDPEAQELFMTAGKALGSFASAHTVNGLFPCLFGIRNGLLVTIRGAGSDEPSELVGRMRVAVHCRLAVSGFNLSLRAGQRRKPGELVLDDPEFNRRYVVSGTTTQEVEVCLLPEVRASLDKLPDTGAAGIRVLPQSVCYFAAAELGTAKATALLDALVMLALNLRAESPDSMSE